MHTSLHALAVAAMVTLAPGAHGFALAGPLSQLSIDHSATQLFSSDAQGDYYGESAGSYMVKEFA